MTLCRNCGCLRQKHFLSGMIRRVNGSNCATCFWCPGFSTSVRPYNQNLGEKTKVGV